MRDKPKTGGFRELVLPGNEFKTCIAVNFPKNADFGGLETNHEIQGPLKNYFCLKMISKLAPEYFFQENV